MLERFKGQAFTLGLFAAVVFAYFLPEIGATGGPLKTEITTKLSIALIFFFQGLTLKSKQLIASALNLRIHIFCQSWIFILSPILMLLIVFMFKTWIPSGIQSGLLFLSVLPTTIFSSTAFTTASNGDSGAALFSATFSNLLGVFITPLWCLALFSNTSGQFPPFGSLVAKIAFYVLLPLLIGQLVRPFVSERVEAWKTFFKRFNNGCILFVVYAAFSNSFVNQVWNHYGFSTILVAIGFSTLFLLLLSALIWTTSELSSSQLPQRIAAFYCSSQKTLAAGVPMASVIFAGQTGDTQEGLIILPLMIYHSLQLFLAGYLNSAFTARNSTA